MMVPFDTGSGGRDEPVMFWTKQSLISRLGGKPTLRRRSLGQQSDEK
jgi:hypothetical protein